MILFRVVDPPFWQIRWPKLIAVVFTATIDLTEKKLPSARLNKRTVGKLFQFLRERLFVLCEAYVRVMRYAVFFEAR